MSNLRSTIIISLFFILGTLLQLKSQELFTTSSFRHKSLLNINIDSCDNLGFDIAENSSPQSLLRLLNLETLFLSKQKSSIADEVYKLNDSYEPFILDNLVLTNGTIKGDLFDTLSTSLDLTLDVKKYLEFSQADSSYMFLICMAKEFFKSSDQDYRAGPSLCNCFDKTYDEEKSCAAFEVYKQDSICKEKSCQPAHRLITVPQYLSKPFPDEYFYNVDIRNPEEAGYLYGLCLDLVFTLSYSAHQGHCLDHITPLPEFPGEWFAKHLIRANHTENGTDYSLAHTMVLLKKTDTAQIDVVVAIRGTIVPDEYVIAYDFEFATYEAINGAIRFTVDNAYSRIAIHVWSLVAKFLVDNGFATSENGYLNFNANIRSVTITGHSAGAAMGTFVGTLARLYTNRVPRIIVFAPPMTGDVRYTTFLQKNTDFVAILSQPDPVTTLPCKGMVACYNKNRTSNIAAHGYAPFENSVMIPASAMPVEWTNEKIKFMDMSFWHICSYGCWISNLISSPSADLICSSKVCTE